MSNNPIKTRKAPQDATRENFTRLHLGLLETEEGRGGSDAKDERGNRFELKSAPNDDKNTASVRSLGFDHIRKFRSRHFIFAYGENFSDGTFNLDEFYYVSPEGMEPWISKNEDKLIQRRDLSDKVKRVMGKELLPHEMKIFETILRWGCKLTVPMISYSYVKKHGICLLEPRQKHLQDIMRDVYPSEPVLVALNKLEGLEVFFESL